MDTNNKQLISQLLTLKAGLSVISVEAEKVETAEKAYNEKKQAYDYLQYQIEGKERSISSMKDTIHRQDGELASYRAKESARKGAGLVILAIAALLLIIGISRFSSSVMIGMALVGASLVVGLIGLNKLFPGRYNRPVAPKTGESYQYKKDMPIHQKQLRELQGKLSAAKQESDAANDSLNGVLAVSLPIAKAMYDALYAEFNDVLRVRDWQYLDLIVHYLDSERADSKKEALLLVDKKVQNDEIVAAIREASEEICSTIRSVGDLIRYDMDRHFNALSAQLAAQHRAMTETIRDVGSSMGRVSEQLRGIEQTSHLQNALLAKIGTDSGKLVRDMDYLVRYTRS